MNNDAVILRSLAREYLEIANHPHNAERRKLHTATNDLAMIRPVVLIDEIPWSEMNIDDELTARCDDVELREYEMMMRKELYRFKHMRADMIVRPYISVQKVIHSTGIGVEIEENTLMSDDQHNNIVAHEYSDQFENCSGLEKLHNPIITYDEQETNRRFQLIGDMIGDIIPIKKVGRNHVTITTWDRIAEYRGLTPVMIDLLDEPEFSHDMARVLTDIVQNTHDQYLKLGLFDTDPDLLHCTPVLNSTLHPEQDNKDYKNIWGRGAAQIFSSVSKDMHNEFDITYIKEVLGKCGLVYYGCCEPLDKKIDIVEQIPNLRKISITPWADVNIAAEAIGKKYVLASKPNPAAVAVSSLDTALLKKEVGNILDACYRNNCSCDIVLKDISSVLNRPQNLFEWEKIVMEMVG